MDPNLFHVDWERVFEVLVAIVIVAFLVERALAVLFESRFFINRFKEKGIKEPIAFILAVAVCWFWDFDAVSMILLKEKVTVWGTIITGGIVAGGSKASIALFKDALGFMSDAEDERQKQRRKRLKGDGLIEESSKGGGSK